MIEIAGVAKVQVSSFLAHVCGLHHDTARQKVLNSKRPLLLVWPRVSARNRAGDCDADIRQESQAGARWRPGTAVERITQETPGRRVVVLVSVQPVRLLHETLVADACPSRGPFILAVKNAVTAAKYRMRFHLVRDPKTRSPAIIVVLIRRAMITVGVL